MEAETIETPDTVVYPTGEVSYPTKVHLQVSLSEAEFPRVENCCVFVNLRIGVTIWLLIETFIWTFLFIAAFYYEIVYVDRIDVIDFYDETEEEWYFYLLFGDRLLTSDQKIRTYIIIINLMLVLIFLTYLAFCLVLLLGIHMRKTCFFIPYFVFDAIFMFLALIGCAVGLIFHHHLFRLCFVFFIIKLYIEICVVSLFLKLRSEKTKSPSPVETCGMIYEEENPQATAV